MTLKGKNALITGSTSGIGLAIAKAFAAQGINLVINGLPDSTSEALAKQIASEFSIKCLFHGANMAKADEIAALVEFANTTLGSVDILVNNAGIQFVSPIEDFPPEKWDAILAINLTSAFHTTRAVVPIMKKNGWGRIINTASAHSLVASPFKSAYVAAKHGLVGFTKTIALETATNGITVNCISPGYVWTPLVEKQIPDTMKARNLTEQEVINDVLLKAQPTKQFVSVEEIAGIALFLCSQSAKNITGANISADGGWTAQ